MGGFGKLLSGVRDRVMAVGNGQIFAQFGQGDRFVASGG